MEQFSRCSGIKCGDVGDDDDDAPFPIKLPRNTSPINDFFWTSKSSRPPPSTRSSLCQPVGNDDDAAVQCQNGKPGKQRTSEGASERTDHLRRSPQISPDAKIVLQHVHQLCAAQKELTPRGTAPSRNAPLGRSDRSFPPQFSHLRCPIAGTAVKAGETSDFIAGTQ